MTSRSPLKIKENEEISRYDGQFQPCNAFGLQIEESNREHELVKNIPQNLPHVAAQGGAEGTSWTYEDESSESEE